MSSSGSKRARHPSPREGGNPAAPASSGLSIRSSPVEIKVIKYQQERAKSNVKPDLQRPKEYLENFSVDAITMVGTLALTEEDVWALLDDAEGGVHRVKVGNYVGRNHGKVVSINPGSVDLIEIVPDGHGGWLERPRAIKLQDGT